MTKRPRIALVFGGDSPEHGVSCLTAANVLAAIDQDRYEVSCIGITQTGQWRQVPPEKVAEYQVVTGAVPHVEETGPAIVWLRSSAGAQIATLDGDRLHDRHSVDVVFALLHGPYGEDGTIQGMFEMMGVRYVGSGVAASANGMDKHLAKVIFEQAGLPIGRYVVITPHDWRHNRDRMLHQVGTLRYPLYVKPARGGSSIGVRRVTDPAELTDAMEFARSYDPKIIVEEGFPDSREIECAVLDAPEHPDGCVTTAPGEIRILDGGFYDFEAKYIEPGRAEVDARVQLDKRISERVQEMARKAFAAIGAEGLARVDTFVTSDGEVFINEINTMPGFTEISGFPAMWQASGMTYPDLVGRLIELTLARNTGLR